MALSISVIHGLCLGWREWTTWRKDAAMSRKMVQTRLREAQFPLERDKTCWRGEFVSGRRVGQDETGRVTNTNLGRLDPCGQKGLIKAGVW
jgi:hypothetical protein